MKLTEQTPVGTNTVPKHIGVPAIILGTGDAEPVAQTIKLLGIDRMDDEAAINQRVDNRSVRYFDSHSNSTGRSGNC